MHFAPVPISKACGRCKMPIEKTTWKILRISRIYFRLFGIFLCRSLGLSTGLPLPVDWVCFPVFDYNIALNQPDTIFRFSEVRIGFVPAIIANFLLRKICPQDARWLLLSGETLSLEKAISVGLIRQLLNKDLLTYGLLSPKNSSTAILPQPCVKPNDYCENWTTCPCLRGSVMRLKTNADARSTEDCRRGIAAFLNKEKIDWTSF